MTTAQTYAAAHGGPDLAAIAADAATVADIDARAPSSARGIALMAIRDGNDHGAISALRWVGFPKADAATWVRCQRAAGVGDAPYPMFAECGAKCSCRCRSCGVDYCCGGKAAGVGS